jgi:thiol-disulfide isomerase/thioredoxin
MRNSIRTLILALVFAPGIILAQNKYLTLSGKITEKNSDSLVVRSSKFTKKIRLNENGVFSDTLKVEKGYYNLFDGKEQTSVYLENGFDLNVTINTKRFDETVHYTGEGADPNNYLAQKSLLVEEVFNDTVLFIQGKGDFDKQLKKIDDAFDISLSKIEKADPEFIAKQHEEKEQFIKYVSGSYEDIKYLREELVKGKKSPLFIGYENYNGSKVSLLDLRGKYIYIDVWATWCGPCKAEIPYLKEVEKQYHDKKIVFVSISVDYAKDHDKWKTMVKEKELSGIQLLADNNFASSFVQEYRINGIPRFILIDQDGNIVSADAPRPSSDSLRKLLNSLKL